MLVASAALTIIVKTFERPHKLRALLDSLELHCPGLPIVVTDDSRYPSPDKRVAAYLCLPYDSGLSRGRNIALRFVETPYFALMDDDFLATRETDLAAMLRVLTRHHLDIIGGHVMEANQTQPEWFTLHRVDNVLIRTCDATKYQRPTTELTRCDFIRNFFVAKTASVRRIGGWNESFKLSEHLEFFVRAQEAKLIIGITRVASVAHNHGEDSLEYMAMRARGTVYLQEWLTRDRLTIKEDWT